MAAAGSAVEKWLALADSAAYAATWTTSSAFFQSSVTQDAWAASLTDVRTPLGALQSRATRSTTYTTSLPGAPEGEYVLVQNITRFERKARAQETVVVKRDDDGQWKVAAYFIK